MPIPKPDDNEMQDHFISRCMGNNTMVQDYPDNKQRLAICFQSWQDRHKREVSNLEHKVLSFEVKQIGLEDERTLDFTGSTEAMDRDGDIIEAYGWDLTDYQKNPVIMGFHEYDKFPYAKSTKTYIDYNSKQLKFEVKFPTISELTSFPGNPDMIAEHAKNIDMAYNMYRNGYMNAVSVGFIGLEDEPMYGDGGEYKGRRYKKQSLLELSLVPVPSNPTALMEARGKGIISDKEMKQLQLEKAVVPYHKYPLDATGAWDGPREIAAASVDDLKIMSTWYDAENAENKGAYKLPHHKQSGYTTVWRAVAAAMAALLGARGGVQIPDSDRRGVYNHLAKHYKDFDKEPPEFKAYTDVELKAMFPELKIGAAISAKNMMMMQDAMNHMQAAMDMMSMMMGMMENEPMQEGCKSATMTMPMQPMKTAQMTMPMQPMDTANMTMPGELMGIRSIISSELKSLFEKYFPQKEETKDIDLDSIEYVPPAKKKTAKDELDIEPGELKNMIADIIKEQFASIN